MRSVYENSKIKGDLAELEVLVALKRQGYAVLVPFGENAPYDMVVESPTRKLYRIQVRFSQWKNGCLTLSLRCASQGRSRPLDRTRIEAFIVWDGTRSYVVPCKDTDGVGTLFTMRGGLAKNKQTKRIRDAATYAEAFHLIP